MRSFNPSVFTFGKATFPFRDGKDVSEFLLKGSINPPIECIVNYFVYEDIPQSITAE